MHDKHTALLVRTHLKRLRLIALLTSGTGACMQCGKRHPPADLNLTSNAIPQLNQLARWTRVNRLVQVAQEGGAVHALCTRCLGRRSAAGTRALMDEWGT